jgi:hypothetical protein
MESNEFKSFVFLDGNSRPYAVMMLDGAPWLCYWNDAYKCFTTMRPVNQGEIFAFAANKLPEGQADMYFSYGKKAGEGR